MQDATDVKLYEITRDSPSKGFFLQLRPGAPFGPEVVLNTRKGSDSDRRIDVEVGTLDQEDVVTSPAHYNHTETFVKVTMGSIVLVLDYDDAMEIGDALSRHVFELMAPDAD